MKRRGDTSRLWIVLGIILLILYGLFGEIELKTRYQITEFKEEKIGEVKPKLFSPNNFKINEDIEIKFKDNIPL